MAERNVWLETRHLPSGGSITGETAKSWHLSQPGATETLCGMAVGALKETTTSWPEVPNPCGMCSWLGSRPG